MKHETSRRALIGGAGLAAIAATVPALASAAMPAHKDREWDRLVVSFHRADAKMKATGKEHDVASTAYQAGRKLLTERPTAPRIEYPRAVLDMTIREMRGGKFTAPEGSQAQYEADLAAWTADEEALEQRTMGDVEQRWEASVDEQDAIAHAIFAHPAPTAAAMIYKIDLAERQYMGCDLNSTVVEHIFADVRRFMRSGGLSA